MARSAGSRPSGFQDYYGVRQQALHTLREQVMHAFAGHGFAPVEPPILEEAGLFLERSGEAIRQRMYIFNDPGGRELCLRPELTIPVARLYLQAYGQRSGIKRFAYSGPAFRYEAAGRGRYRQFQQAGVESFGGRDTEAADAEILGLAHETLAPLGLALKLRLGDLALFEGLVDGLAMPSRWRSRLKRYFWHADKFSQLLTAIQSDEAPTTAARRRLFIDALSELGQDKALAVVEEILALADIKQVGDRSIEEIANRFLESAAERADPISAELLACIEGFLAIEDAPWLCLERLEIYARDAGVDLRPALERMARRLELLDAYGVPLDTARLETSFRRSIEYYSGFIFDFHYEPLGSSSQVCGGGRYDRLLGLLGAREDIPAVGFALGLDRLLLALDDASAAADTADAADADAEPEAVEALIIPIGPDCVKAAIEAAGQLRAGGWRVALDLSGQRPGRIIPRASEQAIPYLVFVGDEERAQGGVRFKSLENHEEHLVPLAELTALARARKPS